MLRDERWYMIRNIVENGIKISEIAKELTIRNIASYSEEDR